MTIALWIAELVLEVSGCILSLRRRLFLLCWLLGFRALVDVATLLIQTIYGRHEIYAWTWTLGQCGQYALLSILCCQLAARMIKDYRPLKPYAWLAALLAATLGALAWIHGEGLAEKWLDAQIASTMSLVAMLLVGWVIRKEELEQPWKGIALGAAVHLGGIAACAMLWETWAVGAKWYPAPALAALAIWNVSALREKKEQLRLALPPKIEPTSVGVGHGQKWVM
ncbi:MAG TPA: hypothetical protein VKW06_00730 [Candidatus Angelobacter sp.]|nr:hypothetical protein [Candidatus Angelobacter sp.]